MQTCSTASFALKSIPLNSVLLEAMAAGATGERSFQETPTWAVAVVCAVFVIISLLIEHGIHSLGKVMF